MVLPTFLGQRVCALQNMDALRSLIRNLKEVCVDPATFEWAQRISVQGRVDWGVNGTNVNHSVEKAEISGWLHQRSIGMRVVVLKRHVFRTTRALRKSINTFWNDRRPWVASFDWKSITCSSITTIIMGASLFFFYFFKLLHLFT